MHFPVRRLACLLFAVSLSGCDGSKPNQPQPPTVTTPSPVTSPPSGGNVPTASDGELSQLQARLKTNPKDEAARVRLAALLDSRGMGSDAEDVLRDALMKGQQTAVIYAAIGTLYLRHQQFRPARDAFRLVVKLNPGDAQGHLRLGSAYSYLQQGKEAEKEYLAALKIDSGLADAYLGLAFVNNTSERYPYAIKYLNEYSKHAGQPGPGLAMLSRVYLNMRMYEKSVEAGLKATQAMPENPTVWYNLGQAYAYRPGDQYVADAAKAFEHAITLQPDSDHARFELGRAYARQKRYDDAIAQYREASRLSPQNGKYLYQLGQLLMQHGNRDEAARVLADSRRLIAFNQRERQLVDMIAAQPRNPQPLIELARLYQANGSSDKARTTYEAVLAVDPKNKTALDALAKPPAR